MTIVFVNASPNKGGNTANLAQTLLAGKDYQTLQLTDYKIYGYGQDFPDDQMDEVLDQLIQADTIVLGSPVYWHSFTGQLRSFLDRLYGQVDDQLAGKKLVLIFQGSAPTQEVLDLADYSMERLSSLYGLTYLGRVSSPADIVI